MSVKAISFPKGGAEDFIRDVKAGVAAYFAVPGRCPKADWSMRLKTVILIAMVLGPYAAILSNRLAPPAMLGCAVIMGIGMAGVGFGISHDALHGAYSSNSTVNRLLGLTFDLLGANSYMWKLTHNVIHHTYTNIDGVDEDIDFAPFLRLSPHARHRWQHRYQHLYAFATYSVAVLFWVFVKDYRYFLKRDLGPYKNKRHPRSEVALLLFTKFVYYLWMIVIPLLVLRLVWWQFVIGFLTVQLTAGLILGVVFQLAHVVEGTDYPLPDASGAMEHTWLLHEMITTSNFAPRNRLVGWYVGGLNYQIEHHLFPKICSVHYPAISSIVRQTAATHGVPYNEHPTLWGAIRSHYRMLKRLGRDPRMARSASTIGLADPWEHRAA
ncbi:MAG: fatty acid desaturase family protein [Gemmatimonadales bacterium]